MESELEALGVKPANCANLNVVPHPALKRRSELDGIMLLDPIASLSLDAPFLI